MQAQQQAAYIHGALQASPHSCHPALATKAGTKLNLTFDHSKLKAGDSSCSEHHQNADMPYLFDTNETAISL